LATYAEREHAAKALQTFRSKEKTEELITEIKDDLLKQKLPTNICPQFFKYKYQWSDKKAESKTTVKNAYSTKSVTKQVNTVVAKKDEKTEETEKVDDKKKQTT
jgi:hypothetical protein